MREALLAIIAASSARRWEAPVRKPSAQTP